MSYIIEVENVNKSIDGKSIIRNLNLSVKRGDIFVLIGPNGAGKSTTIKLLNGIIKPDNGKIYVFNKKNIDERSREKIGILSDTTLLYDHLTGVENVLFFAKLYGFSHSTFIQNRMNKLFELLKLDNDKHRKVGTYSTGMRKRIQLIKSVIHQPDLLFLDEPTSGLDPESIKDVNDFILYLQKEENMTIFLCSHHLDEVELLGNEFGFLANGTIFAQDTLKNLQKQLQKKVIFKVDNINLLSHKSEHLTLQNHEVEFYYQDEEDLANIIEELILNNIKIYNVKQTQTTLKDIYFKLLKDIERVNVEGKQ